MSSVYVILSDVNKNHCCYSFIFLCICAQNQKAVACVERTICISPSTQVSRIEVYRQEEDSDDVTVLQNKERIDWTAGDTLGSLHFRLYDEGGRQVALTQKLAHNIKVDRCLCVSSPFCPRIGKS